MTKEGLILCLDCDCACFRWQEMEDTIKTLQQELEMQRRINQELQQGANQSVSHARERERDLVREIQAAWEQEKERSKEDFTVTQAGNGVAENGTQSQQVAYF